MSSSPPIIYTWTDEAPALATHSFLPIIRAFAGATGVPIETRDISLAGRIVSVFPDVLTEAQRQDESFFIGNMIPTCISDDLEAAAAVNRKTLTMYLRLPNYRNYWKEAGYVEEMTAIEAALEAGERDRLPELMTDRWLSDCTLYGPADRVLDGLAAWYDAGLRTPILVPSSAVGNQMKAFEEFFALFDRLR